MTEPQRSVERFLYAGQREFDGKLTYCWFDETGREMTYSKFKGTAIGSTYTVEVDRSEDRVSVYPGTAEWQSDVEKDPQTAEWQMLTHNAKAVVERLRWEKDAAKERELEHALEPLQVLMRRMRTKAQRTMLIAQILERL